MEIPYKSAYYFNGTNAYADLGAPSAIKNFSQSPFTVVVWFNPGSKYSYGRIFCDDSYPYGDGINGMWALSFGDLGTGRVRFFFRGAGQVILDSNSVLRLNTWYMITAIRDPVNGYRKLYINNVLDNQIASGDTATFTPNTYPVTIGGEASSSSERTYVQGYISNVYIYNRALSDIEIQQIYTYPSDPPTNGLVLWFNNPDFHNEFCKGIWKDRSGNGNDAQLYNVQMAYFQM
jgi:hypothetical protein